MQRTCWALGAFLFCLGIPLAAQAKTESGIASFYGGRLCGGPTASGERFHCGALTAAHRTLPFGTRVRVLDTRTGRSVVVRINDRGPFVRGRVIDLSPAAKEVLGMDGLAHVALIVLRRNQAF
jgi:rare lipoprotein A